MKKLLSLLLAIVLVATSGITVFATTPSEESINAELITDKIAANAPIIFGYDYSWKLTQKTPLFDIDDNIIAYCYDFANTDTELIEADLEGIIPETSYVVVNCTDTGDPILMFGVYGVSPYFNNPYDKAYYLGTMQYYGATGAKYYDLEKGVSVSYDSLCAVDQSYKTALSSSEMDAEEFSSIKNALATNVVKPTPNTTTGLNIVSRAVSLQWRRGCAPTAIAMLLKTRYIIWEETKMIDSLANYMQTNQSGATGFRNIAIGTMQYIDSQNNMTRPDVFGWALADPNGVPFVGFTYNTKRAFKESIDSGHPVGVYINSSTVTTPGYPDGIGPHMMSGIGYSFTSAGDYIICYTTNTRDGQVYFPCTSTGLQSNAWFYLIWE